MYHKAKNISTGNFNIFSAKARRFKLFKLFIILILLISVFVVVMRLIIIKY